MRWISGWGSTSQRYTDKQRKVTEHKGKTGFTELRAILLRALLLSIWSSRYLPGSTTARYNTSKQQQSLSPSPLSKGSAFFYLISETFPSNITKQAEIKHSNNTLTPAQGDFSSMSPAAVRAGRFPGTHRQCCPHGQLRSAGQSHSFMPPFQKPQQLF